MSAVLPGLLVVAALACPAHMLWHMRRGHRAKSGGDRGGGHGEPSLHELRARREAVAAELSSREAPTPRSEARS